MFPHLSFPFCRTEGGGATGSGSNHPVAFQRNEMLDLLYNFRQLQITANGVNLGDPGNNISVNAFTTRQYIDGLCLGVVHRRSAGNVLFEIDLTKVIYRRPFYYPWLRIRFVAGGETISSSAGAATAGGISLWNGSVVDMFSDSAGPFPTIVFGNVRIIQRHDNLQFTPKTAAVGEPVIITCPAGPSPQTDVTFEDVTRVRFGYNAEAVFVRTPDNKAINATVPLGAENQPIMLFEGDDFFYTREYFKPQ